MIDLMIGDLLFCLVVVLGWILASLRVAPWFLGAAN
jgi:hypothetical protein